MALETAPFCKWKFATQYNDDLTRWPCAGDAELLIRTCEVHIVLSPEDMKCFDSVKLETRESVDNPNFRDQTGHSPSEIKRVEDGFVVKLWISHLSFQDWSALPKESIITRHKPIKIVCAELILSPPSEKKKYQWFCDIPSPKDIPVLPLKDRLKFTHYSLAGRLLISARLTRGPENLHSWLCDLFDEKDKLLKEGVSLTGDGGIIVDYSYFATGEDYYRGFGVDFLEAKNAKITMTFKNGEETESVVWNIDLSKKKEEDCSLYDNNN